MTDLQAAADRVEGELHKVIRQTQDYPHAWGEKSAIAPNGVPYIVYSAKSERSMAGLKVLAERMTEALRKAPQLYIRRMPTVVFADDQIDVSIRCIARDGSDIDMSPLIGEPSVFA